MSDKKASYRPTHAGRLFMLLQESGNATTFLEILLTEKTKDALQLLLTAELIKRIGTGVLQFEAVQFAMAKSLAECVRNGGVTEHGDHLYLKKALRMDLLEKAV